jgi:hypothetical protein
MLLPLETAYACLRGLDDLSYFRKKNREPITDLLTKEFQGAALLMYRFIGTANFDQDPDADKIIKQVLLASIIVYLQKVCGYDEAAIDELFASVEFDPRNFSIFDGLE